MDIDAATLTRFYHPDASGVTASGGSVFDTTGPIRLDLCNKIAICSGDPLRIKCDALACPFNVKMRPSISASTSLLVEAGEATQDELRRTKSEERCHHSGRFHTTQTFSLHGGKLPVKHLLPVVTPTYSAKYETAAVNAVDKVFVNVLTQAVENKCRSVALVGLFESIVHDGYDRSMAVHIAMRALRLFMNKYGDKLDVVVLFALDCEELAVFQTVAPVCFPRNDLELAESKRIQSNLPSIYQKKARSAFSSERSVRVTAMVPNATQKDVTKADSLVAQRARQERYIASSYSPLYDAAKAEAEHEKLYEQVKQTMPNALRKPLFVRRFNVTNVKFGAPKTVTAPNGSTYTAFELNVCSESKPTFTMYRRFSQFRDFYSNLLEMAYGEQDRNMLRGLKNVEFPSRGWFWGSTNDSSVVRERAMQLSAIVQKILAVEDPSLAVMQLVEDFLSNTTKTDRDLVQSMQRGKENMVNRMKNEAQTVERKNVTRSFGDHKARKKGARESKRFIAKVSIYNDFKDTGHNGEGNRFITDDAL